MIRCGSLFTGIGVFDKAFLDADPEVSIEWQVEIDKHCNDVLNYHFPNVKRYKDVRDVGAANLSPVDVIFGGFPCQNLSVAGSRAGLAGKQSGLWFEFARIVAELRPKWVVVENVPGLLSSQRGHDFAVILTQLVELGYGVCWRVLDSRFFGVPQRRRRVFVVASTPKGRGLQVLFEPTSGTWHPAAGGKARTGTAPTSSDGSGICGKLGAEQGIASALGSAGGGPDDNDAQGGHLVTHLLMSRGAQASEDGTGRGTPLVAATLKSGYRKCYNDNENIDNLVAFGGGNCSGEINVATALTHHGDRQDFDTETFVATPQPDIIGFSRVDNGRDALLNTSPTLRAGNSPSGHHSGGGNVAVVVPPLTQSGGGVSHTGNERTKADSLVVSERPDRIREFVEDEDRIRGVQDDGHSSTAQEHVYFKPNTTGVNSLDHTRPPQVITPNSKFGVRRLTPVEAERLQGLPDGYTAVIGQKPVYSVPDDLGGEAEIIGYKDIIQSDSARYRQLGNAVTYNVVAWIAKRLVEVEKGVTP